MRKYFFNFLFIIIVLVLVYIYQFGTLDLDKIKSRSKNEDKIEEKNEIKEDCKPLKSFVFLKKHKCASSSFQEGVF